MAIKNFVGRLSGIITYSDGTVGQFAVTVDERGNYSTNDLDDNVLNGYLLLTQKAQWWLNIIDPMLTPRAATGYGMPPLLPDKTVNGFSGNISGIISYDDNTTDSFSSSWDTSREILSISQDAAVVMDRIILGALTYPVLQQEIENVWNTGFSIQRDNSPAL